MDTLSKLILWIFAFTPILTASEKWIGLTSERIIGWVEIEHLVFDASFKTLYHEKTYDVQFPQSSYNPQSTLNTTIGFSGYYSLSHIPNLKINLGSELLLNINHQFEYQNLEAGEEITLDANLLKTELQYNLSNNFSVFSDQRIITIKSLHDKPSAYNENLFNVILTGFEIGMRFKIF